ncbi:MAG: cyclic nucleotide-binding domain-containing protein [Rhodococcus sp. (in: high G+C Gram-positive bacteria)]|uniref:Crp/Fnr family transcriptional regulator n=1 Tax=Rhodococcus sp. TaxID=1831 RepID=UPI003BB1576C
MTVGSGALPPTLVGLSPEHQKLLAELTSPVQFAAGEIILREGDPAQGCWLLRTGTVVLTTTVLGRGTVIVETLHGGDVLGWSWLGPQPVWQFGARATTVTDATQVDIPAFERIADAQPAFGYAVTRALSGVLVARLQSTRARLLDLYDGRREV